MVRFGGDAREYVKEDGEAEEEQVEKHGLWCNLCNKFVSHGEKVYHCTNSKSQSHPVLHFLFSFSAKLNSFLFLMM